MAYTLFGGGPADITTDATGLVVGDVMLQVWTRQTGGVRVSDLRDTDDEPLAGVVVSSTVPGDDFGRITFQAPDNYRVLYLDRGYGQRWQVTGATLALTVDQAITGSATAVTQSSAAVVDASAALTAVSNVAVDVKAFGATGSGVTDDRAAFQTAIDHVPGGSRVRIPAGKYRIGGKLVLAPGTWLDADPAARIIRSSSDYLIANGVQGQSTFGGYNGPGDLRITGGVWDGNAPNYPQKAAIAHISHSARVHIENATFIDVSKSHHLELNSTRDSLVADCRFLGYHDSTGTAGNEALQIDLAYPGSTIIGDGDGTACRSITIRDCYFGPSGTPGDIGIGVGVGSHTQLAGSRNTGITITGCRFDALRGPGVKTIAWTDTLVTGCHMKNCLMGVYSRSDESITITTCRIESPTQHGVYIETSLGVDISSNRIFGIQGLAPNGTQDASAICLASGAKRVTVMGNQILDSDTTQAKPSIYATSSCQAVRVADNILRPKITGDLPIYNGATDSTVDANGNIA